MAVMKKRREAHLRIEFDGERVIGELRDERGAVSAFSDGLDLDQRPGLAVRRLHQLDAGGRGSRHMSRDLVGMRGEHDWT